MFFFIRCVRHPYQVWTRPLALKACPAGTSGAKCNVVLCCTTCTKCWWRVEGFWWRVEGDGWRENSDEPLISGCSAGIPIGRICKSGRALVGVAKQVVLLKKRPAFFYGRPAFFHERAAFFCPRPWDFMRGPHFQNSVGAAAVQVVQLFFLYARGTVADATGTAVVQVVQHKTVNRNGC